MKSRLFISVLLITGFAVAFTYFFSHDPVDYSTDVKPILNQKCISCHGGVKKKGGFSLIFREEAVSPTASGKPAIIPGDGKNSEMIKRLYTHDEEERMPYREEPLSDEEKEILTRWIDEGAKFETHWAYKTVEKQAIPGQGIFSFFNKKDGNEVDRFIDQKLDDIGLQRSAEADKKTLLRRVALDLIGMPADEKTAEEFLNNNDQKAFEKLVDSLLASPHFGEKWTSMWLDLARYADTKGYERDPGRSIWRYRDWLIKSFNEDKPYDQFLTEQLAGDLLPDATDEQLVATAFHRNTMTNDEGGTDNEEYRTAAVIDRVNTTWETLMGTSFSCVQCHGHPYDPFVHTDYYKFMAYFNNTRDEDTYDDYPLLREFKEHARPRFDSVMQWVKMNGDGKDVSYFKTLMKTGRYAINSITADSMVNAALEDTKFLALRKTSWAVFRSVDLSSKRNLLIRYRSGTEKGTLAIFIDHPQGRKLTTVQVKKHTDGWGMMDLPLADGLSGKHDLYFYYDSPKLENKDQTGIKFDWLVFSPAFPGSQNKEYDTYKNLFLQVLNKPEAVITPIMLENPEEMSRKTYVFERGNWLMKTTEVSAGLPEILPAVREVKLKNRLGLAQWMTNKKNPLTARTMVNRLWEQLFGTGLVETLEDLGSQGASPTHRELLDHLSYAFMHEDNWSIKNTIKRIVMSATYRQSSIVTEKSKEKDPLNKYYSRAPRIRLNAEQIRDQALAVTGILSKKMYGPGVMPYQPEGIWASPYAGEYWKQSQGEDQYRRAVYTYWKRTSAYPSMITFDGVAREVCVARRIRTNTPLQALTLMNDSTYWDISVQFAKKISQGPKQPVHKQIQQAYEKTTGQPISPAKMNLLTNLYGTAYNKIRKEDERIKLMMADSCINPKDYQSIAALSVVTNTILNLDEVITKNEP